MDGSDLNDSVSGVSSPYFTSTVAQRANSTANLHHISNSSLVSASVDTTQPLLTSPRSVSHTVARGAVRPPLASQPSRPELGENTLASAAKLATSPPSTSFGKKTSLTSSNWSGNRESEKAHLQGIFNSGGSAASMSCSTSHGYEPGAALTSRQSFPPEVFRKENSLSWNGQRPGPPDHLVDLSRKERVVHDISLSQEEFSQDYNSTLSLPHSVSNSSLPDTQYQREDFRLNISVDRRTLNSSRYHTPAPPPPHSDTGHQTTAFNSTGGGGLDTTLAGFGVNPGCFVAVVEGRGGARGEIGMATISLSNPTLVVCQFTDTRTYVRTLTKLAVFGPAEILLANNGQSGSSGMKSGNNELRTVLENIKQVGGGGNMHPTSSQNKGVGAPSADIKLHQEIADAFPAATIVHIHRKYFKDTKGLASFKQLCAPEYSAVELQLRHKYYGLAASYALLKYVEYIKNVLYAPKSLKVEFQGSEESTMIDVETARHIELLVASTPTVSGGGGGKKKRNSLFGLMNRCVTSGGVRFLRSSLFQPPRSVDIINQRAEAVEELIGKPELLMGIQSVLSRQCDIDQLLCLCAVTDPTAAAKASAAVSGSGSNSGTETVAAIDKKINLMIGLKHVLDLVGPLHTVLSQAESSDMLMGIRETLEDPNLVTMMQKIQVVIHDEAKLAKGSAAMKLQRCFAVRKGLNDLLDTARTTYCRIVDDIEAKVTQLGEAHGYPMRLGYNASRGYHIQMTVQAPSARGEGKGKKMPAPAKLKPSDLPKTFLRPQITKNTVFFTTLEMVNADRQSQDTLKSISLMSNIILTDLLLQLRTTIGSLYRLSDSLSTLDFLASLAEFSSQPGFVRPTFGADKLKIMAGRHPILEHLVADREEVIANDVEAVAHVANFNLLTGSNMAGKSTYLKMIILMQILAQSGGFVPAKEAEFRVCDTIFSRVGTSDNIECNASTFTLEMKETSYILNNISSNSLVILDELGRGTSTSEGAAICWAICEALAKRHSSAFTFLATHFALLPKLEQLNANVKNYHFLSGQEEGDNPSSVRQTHKLVPGAASLSGAEGSGGAMGGGGSVGHQHYGLELAKASAFPEALVAAAKAKAAGMTSAYVPEVDPSAVQMQNYSNLYAALKSLKSRMIQLEEEAGVTDDESGGGEISEGDKNTILEYARNLQRAFLPMGQNSHGEENEP